VKDRITQGKSEIILSISKLAKTVCSCQDSASPGLIISTQQHPKLIPYQLRPSALIVTPSSNNLNEASRRLYCLRKNNRNKTNPFLNKPFRKIVNARIHIRRYRLFWRRPEAPSTVSSKCKSCAARLVKQHQREPNPLIPRYPVDLKDTPDCFCLLLAVSEAGYPSLLVTDSPSPLIVRFVGSFFGGYRRDMILASLVLFCVCHLITCREEVVVRVVGGPGEARILAEETGHIFEGPVSCRHGNIFFFF
jgi:hypothetical protein